MRIAQSSNVIGAVYVVCFDGILPLLLAWFIRVFLSSTNLKLIYDDRTPVCLKSTRLSFSVHQGLAKKRTGRAVAFISMTIIALAAAGSFSINGVSRKVVSPRKVPVLIDAGSREEDLLDFTKHVSKNGNLVSGLYLITSSAVTCATALGKEYLVYSAFTSTARVQDLSSVKWSSYMLLPNTSCLSEKEGFVNRVAIQHVWRFPSERKETRSRYGDGPALLFFHERSQKLGKGIVGPGTVAPNKPGAVPQTEKGPYEVLEVWCSKQIDAVCVGAVKLPNGFSTVSANRHGSSTGIFTNEGESGNILSGEVRFNRARLKDRPAGRTLRSMAFLMSWRLPLSPEKFLYMGMLSVNANATIEEYTGTANETEVDMILLAATLGPSVILTLMLGIVAYFRWRRHTVKPGRRNYNCFHTATDLLSCATSEAVKDGTCRFGKKKSIMVRLENGEPQLLYASCA